MTHQQNENNGADEAEDEVIIGPEPTMVTGPVAGGVDRGCHADNGQGQAVAEQIVDPDPGTLALEHLDQEDVDLKALEEHPHERCQEEVVQQAGHHSAQHSVRRCFDSQQENELGDEQAQTQIFVDCCAIALQ